MKPLFYPWVVSRVEGTTQMLVNTFVLKMAQAEALAGLFVPSWCTRAFSSSPSTPSRFSSPLCHRASRESARERETETERQGDREIERQRGAERERERERAGAYQSTFEPFETPSAEDSVTTSNCRNQSLVSHQGLQWWGCAEHLRRFVEPSKHQLGDQCQKLRVLITHQRSAFF